ncbi:laccase precursor [Fusarium albosuccineum]|uniref:Laccase n=1 Tax=Fusarium albosuccineum TaxID=1237068 RepID=A0A8H4KXD2_9HYPO|nr:laccase precursor [Fusarium albosuccineum]
MWFLKRITEFLFLPLFPDFPDQDRIAPEQPSAGSVVTEVGVFNSSAIDNSCNSPGNQQEWCDGLNIQTDYEVDTPKGKVRKFFLEITNERIAPDGYWVDRMLFNKTYPGPTLEGDWGDTFEITVKNSLTNNNGTSVHWHGIRQLNTNWMDGVAGVTECPIPPGENFTYIWHATQYGTSWYHSHFSLQYPDGLVGALKINGPTSMNFDVDLGPVLLTDYFHADAFSLVDLEYMGRPPTPDSMLMNGNGTYYCCPKSDPNCLGESKLTEFIFEEGKTYKMSLVNTAVSTHMTFWIDNHNFSVVSTDFVPITPYNASVLNIAIGQRYDIIITANATMADNSREDFWIHARDCDNGGARSNLGIIRYNASSTDVPWTPPVDKKHLCYGCLDEKSSNLKPIVKRNLTNDPANIDYITDSFKVHLVGYPDEYAKKSALHKWVLKDSSLYLDWRQPSLSLVKIADEMGWPNPKFPVGYEPVSLNYKNGSWVYFLIEGKFQESLDNSTRRIYEEQPPVAHPIHVHGHDFVILASGTEEYNSSVKLDLDNPPRRDVALLPVDGYLIIGFQIDNPGVWLMHCHIAWHASGGLALQFIESPEEIGPMFRNSGILPKYSEMCTNWGAYYTMFNKNNGTTQEDSGI